MSKSNPKKAVAALLPLPIEVADGIYVNPMTLGMFAALERINSPLVTGEDAKDTLDLIPSLYLLTHDPREIFDGNIVERSMRWANEMPTAIVARIKEACERQILTLTDVVPELSPEDLKKKTAMTGGSPTTRRSRPKRSAGDTPKSCGKSRQA